MNSGFKMTGWSGYQNSPIKAKPTQKTDSQGRPISTIEDDPDYQVPVQPAENPDLEITGGSLGENIYDLEDRIGFLEEKYSEYDRPLTSKEKKAMKVLKDRLEIEYSKRDKK